MAAMDMMINAAFAALKLDPDKTREQIAALQNWVIQSIKALDHRVHAMEEDRALMHEKLDAIRIQNETILSLLTEQYHDGRTIANLQNIGHHANGFDASERAGE